MDHAPINVELALRDIQFERKLDRLEMLKVRYHAWQAKGRKLRYNDETFCELREANERHALSRRLMA